MASSLNLSDLIEIVQLKNRELPPTVVEAAVRRVFREIIAALADGRRAELRGFGVLKVRELEGSMRRNPPRSCPNIFAARQPVVAPANGGPGIGPAMRPDLDHPPSNKRTGLAMKGDDAANPSQAEGHGSGV